MSPSPDGGTGGGVAGGGSTTGGGTGGGVTGGGGATGGGTTGGGMTGGGGGGIGPIDGGVPRAVLVARTTTIPACTLYVDAANTGTADGTVANPFATLNAAVSAASNDAVICVAQGTYAEELAPQDKYFTLAGGFQSGMNFTVRDSALYVTKAQGNTTNKFFYVDDPGPSGSQLTAIDGFEITGYARGIERTFYVQARFDLTNNYIHDNACTGPMGSREFGAGFVLANVTGTVSNNVIARNSCGFGGGGAFDEGNGIDNDVTIIGNRVEGNRGTEIDDSHGGGLYLAGDRFLVVGNEFIDNRTPKWGGGLYAGARPPGGLTTFVRLGWNVYRDNRAGDSGGGFFCDDSARCVSEHEIYERNCGGNILLDSGNMDTDPTIASFDFLTNVQALNVDCTAPGPGVVVQKDNLAPDSYVFTNAIFFGNQSNADFVTACSTCANATVNVSWSSVQTQYANGGIPVTFAPNNRAPVDPLFVDANAHDFHLRSTFGHWTPTGMVQDAVSSPLLGAADPARPVPQNPARAGTVGELGAYGDSPEASFTQ